MPKKASILAGGAVLAALVIASCNSSGSSVQLAVMSGVNTAEMISLQDAVAAALERVPGGFAVEVGLEIEEDDEEREPAAYEVVIYVEADQKMVEAEVDAYTGEVLEVEVQEDGEEDEEEGR